MSFVIINDPNGGISTTVRCGQNNTALAAYSTISGGRYNTIITNATYSVIGGGYSGTSTGCFSVLAGGCNNIVNQKGSVVGGGAKNTALGEYNIILGGYCNTTNYLKSIVLGGDKHVSLSGSTIAGGDNNKALGVNSFVSQGLFNTASGNYSSVIGGTSNTVIGHCSVVLGGSGLVGSQSNTAYVPKLNINTIPTGSIINNLAYDSSGNVIVGRDIYLSGASYTSNVGILNLQMNNGNVISVGGLFGQNVAITGGTLDYTNGSLTLDNTGGPQVTIFGLEDYFTTGFTFDQGTYDLTVELNNGSAYTVNLGILSSDMTITGGTYDPNTGVVTFTNNSGGTFGVSGFVTGYTDIFLTGGTFVGGDLTLTNTDGSSIVVTGFSAMDTYVTGGTYDNNTGDATFYNNQGGSFVVTGFTTGFTDYYTTGFTFDQGTYDLTVEVNDGNNYTVNLGIFAGDFYVTGGTYDPNTGTATFTNNSGGTFSVTNFLQGYYDNYVISGSYNQYTGTINLQRQNGNVTITGIPYAVVQESGQFGSTIRVNSNNQINNSWSNYSTVSGGFGNIINSSFSTIGGGYYNTANFIDTVGGGYYNYSDGYYGVIGGGVFNNLASGQYSQTIAGGFGNTVNSYAGTISGGWSNSVMGSYGSIGGGYNNTVNGQYGFAVGAFNKVYPSATNSSILAGSNIIATAPNTAYVPQLNISTLVSSPAVNTLGIDASGFVVATTTPNDYYLTGLTFDSGTFDLTASVNNGNDYTVNLGVLSSDMTVTGGTYNPVTGIVTFTTNSGNTFNVTGFTTGYTDIFLTGGTYSPTDGKITLTNTDGSTVVISGLDACCITGGTLDYANGNLVLDSATSQITIPGLQDIFLSAVTYDNSTGFLNLTMNNSTSFNVGPFLTVDSFVTGGSYSNGVLTLDQNGNGQTITIPGFPTQDYYVTGGTFNSGTGILTLDRNGNGSATVNIGSVSGVMVQGSGTGSTLRCSSNNTSAGNYSFVVGSFNKTCTNADYSSVLGGASNVIYSSAIASTISGGLNNKICSSALNNFIGAGNSNTITSVCSSIVGGNHQVASGIESFIGGGECNTVSGNRSSILGGAGNTVSSDYSSANGRNNIVSCSGAHAIGVGIVTDRVDTTFVNNLSIINIPDETSLPLPTGSVYKCSLNSQLYIV